MEVVGGFWRLLALDSLFSPYSAPISSLSLPEIAGSVVGFVYQKNT